MLLWHDAAHSLRKKGIFEQVGGTKSVYIDAKKANNTLPNPTISTKEIKTHR